MQLEIVIWTLVISGVVVCSLFVILSGYRFIIALRKHVHQHKRQKLLTSNNKVRIESEPPPEFTNAVRFVQVGVHELGIDRGKVDEYFDVLKQYIQKAEREIFILRYIPNEDSLSLLSSSTDPKLKDDARYLGQKYSEYYQEIERVVKNGITYRRLFQLPKGQNANFVNRHLGSEVFLEPDGVIRAGVLSMTRRSVSHLKNLWENTKEQNVNFEIQILPFAPRSYSYIVIDEKYILSIYSRETERGGSFIDELYVNKLSSIKDQVYKRRIEFLELSSQAITITKENFEDAINKNEEYMQQISKRAELESFRQQARKSDAIRKKQMLLED